MKTLLSISIPVLLSATLLLAGASPPAKTPAADDPRSAALQFFNAVQKGDTQGAWKCWFDDSRGLAKEDQQLMQQVIRGWIHQLCANAQLNRAIQQKFPQDAKPDSPTAEQIQKAQCIQYLRLAIVKWGAGEDDGLPMVLDNSEPQPVWKISMQQWYEVNRSSVGDAMLISEAPAKSAELTAKEVLDGRFHSIRDVQIALIRHTTEFIDATEKKE